MNSEKMNWGEWFAVAIGILVVITAVIVWLGGRTAPPYDEDGMRQRRSHPF